MTIAEKLIQIADNTPLVAEAVKEKKPGKNLFDPDRTLGTFSSGGQPNSIRSDIDFSKFYLGMTRNNYYYPYQVPSYSYDGNTLTFSVSAAYYGIGFPVPVLPNTEYIVSADKDCSIYCGFFTKDGAYISESTRPIYGITTPENCEILMLCFCGMTAGTTYTVKNVQVEQGLTATEYEPYKDPQLYEEALAKANGIKTALLLAKEAIP